MTATEVDRVTSTPEDVAATWLDKFADAVEARDAAGLKALFAPGSTWRDLVAFTWDIRNFRDHEGICAGLLGSVGEVQPTSFRVHTKTPPTITSTPDSTILTGIFDFETKVGPASGTIVLVSDAEGRSWLANGMMTKLEGFHAWPERSGVNRPPGKEPGVVVGRVPWAERRRRETEFLDDEPQVVVMGAGQAGLMFAARLTQLGVKTLVVERNARVGDNWRKRYGSLALHDSISMDHFPYIPFPSTWPKYTPKDKLADFFEFYASAMELNVWTGSNIRSTTFRPEAEQWDIEVARADGTVRTVHPRHFVSAVGMNALPRLLHFAGEERFKGVIVHSGDFSGGENWRGKNVIVIGAGVSGHDIVQDCYEQGAHVVMVQRSSTNTIAIETHLECFMSIFAEGGPDPEDADLFAASFPWDQVLSQAQVMQEKAVAKDAELRAGLEKAGFRIDSGVNGAGAASVLLSGRNSYYFDIGAASLIIDGKVPVLHAVIDHLTEDSAVLADGTVLPADLVVVATGYSSILEATVPAIGTEIADRVKYVYQLGKDGEMLNVFRRTPQPGLWFMLGTLQFARFYSKVLALQIKAIEEGLTPYAVDIPTPKPADLLGDPW
jgi:putative flavoprotein involved in K+ transport